MYLMGDYNVNLLNIDNHLLTSEFLEMFYSYSFLPVINKPTRVTCNSAINKFCDKLQNSDWSDIILSNNCQDSFTKFYNQYKDLYNECFPVRN